MSDAEADPALLMVEEILAGARNMRVAIQSRERTPVESLAQFKAALSRVENAVGVLARAFAEAPDVMN